MKEGARQKHGKSLTGAWHEGVIFVSFFYCPQRSRSFAIAVGHRLAQDKYSRSSTAVVVLMYQERWGSTEYRDSKERIETENRGGTRETREIPKRVKIERRKSPETDERKTSGSEERGRIESGDGKERNTREGGERPGIDGGETGEREEGGRRGSG